jgi:DNA-directed RNA polymerase subunit RPC12/RpoP
MIDASKVMKDGCTFCRREVPFEDEKPLLMTAHNAYNAYGMTRIYICEYCDELNDKFMVGTNELMRDIQGQDPFQYPTKKDIHRAIAEDLPVECLKCNAQDPEGKDWRLISPDDKSFSILCPECNKKLVRKQKEFAEKFIEQYAKLEE